MGFEKAKFYLQEAIVMCNDLFSGKESIRDIMFAIEDNLKEGLFSQAVEYFDRLIEIDDKYPLLYERLACVKFWINREENIHARKAQAIEFAKILTSYYKEFIPFASRYNIDETVDIAVAIKHYVFGHVVAIFENEYKRNCSADVLRDLCDALVEIKQYKKAVKGFEHLLVVNHTNGYVLSKLALLYGYLKDDERSKFYLRDVLFYDPLNMEKELFETNAYLNRALILASEHTNAMVLKDDKELLFWGAVYADVYNVWNKTYTTNKSEVLTIRKMISRFEADCKKKDIRNHTAPRLFLAYTRLISYLIINAKSNIGEIEFIAKKMEVLNTALTREFVESLNI